jgi:hypothetical protein
MDLDCTQKMDWFARKEWFMSHIKHAPRKGKSDEPVNDGQKKRRKRSRPPQDPTYAWHHTQWGVDVPGRHALLTAVHRGGKRKDVDEEDEEENPFCTEAQRLERAERDSDAVKKAKRTGTPFDVEMVALVRQAMAQTGLTEPPQEQERHRA